MSFARSRHTHTQTLTENARIITNNNNRKKHGMGMWCLAYFVFLFFSRFIFTRIYVAFSRRSLNVNCVHNVRQPKANCGHSAREDLDSTVPRQSKAQSIIKTELRGHRTKGARTESWLALGLALFAAIETCTKCFINTHSHACTDRRTHHNRPAAVAGRQSSICLFPRFRLY